MNKIDQIFMKAYDDDRQARRNKSGCIYVIIPLLILLAQFLLMRLLGI